MKSKLLAIGLLLIILVGGCAQGINQKDVLSTAEFSVKQSSSDFPKIASWLAKKDEIIESNKPYDLVMTAWFTPEEASAIRQANPDVILLAGLSANWVWDNAEWMSFLTSVANYGKESITITEDMYLHSPAGERCGFGWASQDWGHEEIYAMDPGNEKWVQLITSFYRNVLEQPQHDGIIVDMVVEENFWCPEAISAEVWLRATTEIFKKIQKYNTENKLVVFNAGKSIVDIDDYSEFFDGYLMENFLGEQLNASFKDGLAAADSDKFVIFNVDTDDSGIIDLKKMQLGLTLSMLNDNTYFTYDFGPRDHGQAWWFPEYDVDLGAPLGAYDIKENAYWREFENGFVVSSPDADTTIEFDHEFTDITTNTLSKNFTIEKGDGRIFIR